MKQESHKALFTLIVYGGECIAVLRLLGVYCTIEIY